MMMTRKHKMQTLGFLLTAPTFILSGCNVRSLAPNHAQLTPVSVEDPNQPTDPGAGGSEDPTNPGQGNHDLTACEYWNDLPSAKGLNQEVGQTMQLFDSLALKESKPGAGDFKLMGRHNLKKLPQVLFALSSEANGGKAKLNPPNFEEFMALAKQAYEAGELSWIKYNALKVIYFAAKNGNQGAQKKMISSRNDAIVAKVEKSLPGVFTGNAGPLKDDQLLADLMKQTGTTTSPESLFTRMKVLQKEVPLFPSTSWRDRRIDAAIELDILGRTSDDKSLPATEKVCRFAIVHRFQAQILALKGFNGAPAIETNGLLKPIPSFENALFPFNNLKGVFGVVVDEKWVKEQLDNPTARAENTESTEEFLNALNYLTTLTGHRLPTLWSLNANAAAPGTVRINAKLLQLGMGFFGFTAKILARDELNLTVPNRILLREDSADNVALLGHVAMNIANSFSTLNEPNELEQQILSPEQIEGFIAPYPDGVVAKMDRLTLGLAFEGLYRVQTGEGSENLKEMIRRVGRKTHNSTWTNLP